MESHSVAIGAAGRQTGIVRRRDDESWRLKCKIASCYAAFILASACVLTFESKKFGFHPDPFWNATAGRENDHPVKGQMIELFALIILSTCSVGLLSQGADLLCSRYNPRYTGWCDVGGWRHSPGEYDSGT